MKALHLSMKGLALSASVALLSLALLGCGGGEELKTMDNQPSDTQSTTQAAESSAKNAQAAKKEASQALSPDPVGAGAGDIFSINLPVGSTFDENMSCYKTPDGAVSIWTSDASSFEKEDNFKDAMALLSGSPKKIDKGPYILYLIEEPGAIYGPTTHYFVDFKGQYKDLYGCKIYISSNNGKIEDTQTDLLENAVLSVRKKGDPLPEGVGPIAEKEDPFASFKLSFSPEQSAAMSNFMNGGRYVSDGERYYGLAFGADTNAELASFKLKSENGGLKPEEAKILTKTDFYTLHLSGDLLYYIQFEGGLYSLPKTGGEPQLLQAEAGDYLQIVGDHLYFADKNYHYCRTDMQGQNLEKVIDKEIYCPYFLSEDWLLYQDDADGERLHLRHLPSGADKAITREKADMPVIWGNQLFCIMKTPEGNRLAKIDLSKYNKDAKADELPFPVEMADKPISSNLAISYDGYLFTGTSMGRQTDLWKDLTAKDETAVESFVYAGKNVDIRFLQPGETVERIDLLDKTSGAITAMPGID